MVSHFPHQGALGVELTERHMRSVLEADRGYSQYLIAEKVGCSQTRVHQILKKARQHLDEIELQLLANTKTGEGLIYMVPFGPDRDLALGYFEYVKRQL